MHRSAATDAPPGSTTPALEQHAVRVEPGAGLVLRTPGVLLVVPVVPTASLTVLRELLDRCRDAGDPTGRRLVRRVAGLLSDAEPDDVPGFGLLLDTDRGLVAVLHGDVELVVDGPAPQSASGASSLAWTECPVRGPFDGLRLAAAGDALAAPPFPDHDLVAGCVPGSGAVVLPRGRTAAVASPLGTGALTAAAPEPAPDPAHAEVPEPAHAEVPELPPTVTWTGPAVPAPSQPVLPAAAGSTCARGHANPAGASFCPQCGLAVARTRETVLRPRPASPHLQLDDGSTVRLDTDHVLGRDPAEDDAVLAGRARPLVLNDDVDGVSRVHAAVSLRGGTVLLRDRGSANGTFTHSGDGRWAPVPAGQDVVLAVGTHVRLGRRSLVLTSEPRS